MTDKAIAAKAVTAAKLALKKAHEKRWAAEQKYEAKERALKKAEQIVSRYRVAAIQAGNIAIQARSIEQGLGIALERAWEAWDGLNAFPIEEGQ